MQPSTAGFRFPSARRSGLFFALLALGFSLLVIAPLAMVSLRQEALSIQGGPAVTVEIVAGGAGYTPSEIVVPRGANIRIDFVNRDPAAPLVAARRLVRQTPELPWWRAWNPLNWLTVVTATAFFLHLVVMGPASPGEWREALLRTGGAIAIAALSVEQRMVIVGVAIGIVFTVAATRLVTTFLYGVEPTDPMTLAASAAVLAAVAIGAGEVPAWRASRMDPVLALREE